MKKIKGLMLAGSALLGAAMGSALGAATLEGAIGFWTS
jgi:hypothetical protein